MSSQRNVSNKKRRALRFDILENVQYFLRPRLKNIDPKANPVSCVFAFLTKKLLFTILFVDQLHFIQTFWAISPSPRISQRHFIILQQSLMIMKWQSRIFCAGKIISLTPQNKLLLQKLWRYKARNLVISLSFWERIERNFQNDMVLLLFRIYGI